MNTSINLKLKTLDRYLIRQFLWVFITALFLFAMLIFLLDLFLYLTILLNNGVSLSAILKTSLFYIPKCISFSLPVSLLFASAYTLGDLNAKNELSTILGSGVPFWRFGFYLIILGIALSVIAFFFEDFLVIPTLRNKNRKSRELLGTYSENSSRIVIKLEGGRLIYSVDFFDSFSQTLSGLTIIELDENQKLNSMVFASKAAWQEDSWSFSDPILYNWDKNFLRPSNTDTDRITAFLTERYREKPETFRRISVVASDLNARDIKILVKDLRRAGLPVSSALAEYHRRFSFSAASFVMILLSLSAFGRFKKNILLLSLFASLGTAVVYYVIEMLSMMCAQAGILNPFLGAWIPVFGCTAAGFLLLRFVKL